MNRSITIALAMFTGAGLGAAVVQCLHAQARPPAFSITETTVTDQEGYFNEYVPLAIRSIEEFGGKFIVRGGKTVSITGSPPAPRILIVQFDSLEKAQAWVSSPAVKAAAPIGLKYQTAPRTYQVEGVSP